MKSNTKGPQISSKTLVPKTLKSFQHVVFRRIWLGFLAITLILSPIAGILWNPHHNTALADTAEYGFAKQMGSVSADQGQSISVDSSGNVYSTGYFQGTVDFDPGAGTSNLVSAGNADIFISKLDSDGDFVWAKAMGGTGTDSASFVFIDGSDNIYTTGNFSGTVDFDPGAGTSNLVAAGSFDIFVSKLDSDGDFVWAKAMGGTGTDIGRVLSIDGSGNIYTTGYFNGTADFDPGAGTSNLISVGGSDAFISKLDSDGDFVWAKALSGGGDSDGTGIVVDDSGNIYTTGYLTGTADFDPGAGTSNITSVGSYDAFISKLDSDGNFVWAKALGGADIEISRGVDIDSSDNVYTTGYFQNTADFDPGAGTSNLTTSGGDEIYISKLDSSGNFIWAKALGGASGDQSQFLIIDSDDNIYTSGYFQGTADFDPGAGTSNLVSAGSNDSFISKLDSDGDFVWAKSMGGTGGERAYSLSIDSSGNVYSVGFFSGTADFDPGAGTSNLTSAGGNDIYVSKLTQVFSPTVTSSVASEVNKVEAVFNGNITNTGGEVASERGFEYGLTNSYGTTLSQTDGSYSTGAFSETLTGLSCSTVYYFRSYATNSGGTGYGSETTFATSGCTSSGSSSNSSQSNTQTPTDTTQTPTIPTTPTDGAQPIFTIPNTNPGGNPSGQQIRSTESLLPPILLFTRNLGLGSVGTDVQRLQQFMNTNGYSVSATGAGATNQETTFFGPRTKQAVKVFQEAFAAEILTPLGLTQGTGYFGNSTRALLNSLIR